MRAVIRVNRRTLRKFFSHSLYLSKRRNASCVFSKSVTKYRERLPVVDWPSIGIAFALCQFERWNRQRAMHHTVSKIKKFWLALSTGFAPTSHSSVTIIPLTSSDWKLCFTLTLRRRHLLRDQLKMPDASVRVLQFNWFIHKLQWCLVWTSLQKEIQKQVAAQLKPIILVSF